MGKYMRKSKSSPNNGVEVSVNVIDNNITSFGVRTRAKTLALKTLNSSPIASASAAVSSSSFGYLQLRNRRLLRLKPPKVTRNNQSPNLIGNPNLCYSEGSSPNSRVSVRVRVKVESNNLGENLGNDCGNCEIGDEFDDVCFGENVVESDLRERSTRESTPSNLIRDPDVIHTPGSTTRPASSPQPTRRLRSSTQRSIPTSREVDRFFAEAEEHQQREFIQKYNFDPANDKPLPGRYDWEKLKP